MSQIQKTPTSPQGYKTFFMLNSAEQEFFLLINIVVVVVLLFYVHGKHLRSCGDGQST